MNFFFSSSCSGVGGEAGGCSVGGRDWGFTYSHENSIREESLKGNAHCRGWANRVAVFEYVCTAGMMCVESGCYGAGYELAE